MANVRAGRSRASTSRPSAERATARRSRRPTWSPGSGLEGDRYFAEATAPSTRPRKTGQDLTLIEAEAIEGLARDDGIELAPGEARRNVVTRGIALNDLVGRRFRVGEVECVGSRLCEPCSHLERLTQPGRAEGARRPRRPARRHRARRRDRASATRCGSWARPSARYAPMPPGRGSELVSTTSKSAPLIAAEACRSSLFQPRDGAPLMNHGEPSSARIIP